MTAIRSIRRLEAADIPEAMRLVREVFSEYNAEDYSLQGVREFGNFTEVSTYQRKMAEGEYRIWGCFAKSALAGVAATRDRNHICLLFVGKTFHRQGIAGSLVHVALEDCREAGSASVTVNSSRYAVDVYRALGFAPTGPERTVNGIIFVPMQRPL